MYDGKTCHKCPSGTYAGLGADTCMSCPPNHITLKEKASLIDDCGKLVESNTSKLVNTSKPIKAYSSGLMYILLSVC